MLCFGIQTPTMNLLLALLLIVGGTPNSPATSLHAHILTLDIEKGNFCNRAIRLIVLIREDLLATLAARHAILLLLAHLAGSELLLLGRTLKNC
jgi:hypothetical protein